MLAVNDKPILTYKDFVENYDIEDIMASPEKYVEFFEKKLRFSDLNNKCINAFKHAASGEPLPPIASSSDFWIDAEPPSDNQDNSVKSLSDEFFIIYSHSGAVDWKRKFILNLAAAILSGRRDISKSEHTDNGTGTTTGLSNELNFGDYLSEISLPLGVYSCKYSPNMQCDNPKIHTVHLLYDGGGFGRAEIKLGSITEKVSAGKDLYLNICNGEVVRILPKSTEANASVSAARNNDRVSIISGKICAAATVEISQQLYNYTMVEVAVVGNEFWFLTEDGIMKSADNFTPKDFQHHYVSLAQALGKIGKEG